MSETCDISLVEAAQRSGITISDFCEPASKFVVLDDVTLHHLDWGNESGHPILCLHGSAQNAHMWDFTALGFCRDYRIIALDQRGHGDSDWAKNHDYSREAHVRDITAIVSKLVLDTPILLGLSMGGSNAIAYAAENPGGVRALIVVDSGPELSTQGNRVINDFISETDVLDSFEEFVNRVVRYSPQRPEWQIRSSLKHNLKRLADGRWTWKYDSYLRSHEHRFRQTIGQQGSERRWQMWESVNCPILLIRGKQSDMLTINTANEMIRRNPGSRLVEIPNAGHRVPGDNPVAFEEALREFLAE